MRLAPCFFLVVICGVSARADDTAPGGRSPAGVVPAADSDRAWWSLEPLGRVSLPVVRQPDLAKTPVDLFWLARLEHAGCSPAAGASRVAMVRRVTFDLLGLPPSPHRVSEFVEDETPAAWNRLVDRLLASPQYGERWGRHWLDLVRFAESYGFEHDLDNAHAWHYRDWVVEALNADVPYNEFVQLQIAADEIAVDRHADRRATGFLAAGVHNADFAAIQVESERYDELDDIVSTLGTAFLGLTFNCARCHDHKFDPITQEDYYRLVAAFARTVRGEVDLELVSGKARVLVAGEGVPPLARVYNPGPAFFETVSILERGDPQRKKGAAWPGFPRVLVRSATSAEEWLRSAPEGAVTTMRRRAVAEWLTDVEHGAGALLARVIVNRVWQHHFGRGLVATVSDFGVQGALPTHPELLDWLAMYLVDSGWSLKSLHRVILTSAVYQQGAEAGGRRAPQSPDLFAGRVSRRVEAEAIRDAMLSAAGLLDLRMSGPGSLDESHVRRSIYFTVKRSRLPALLKLFDLPDALQGQGERPTTTVAPQALALLNHPQVIAWSRAFALELVPSARRSLPAAIDQAYRRALGRSATADEATAAAVFILEGMTGANAATMEVSLQEFCLGLFALNEFSMID